MSIDEQHIALPKLYGAPAYARPPRPGEGTPKPFDPDDLPIVAAQTEEDRQLAESLPARAWAPGGTTLTDWDGNGHSNGNGNGHGSTTDTGLKARSFSLRGIAGKFVGGE